MLATFITLGAVRGDAERGLLQPLIVRPLGRHAYLAGRLLAAAVVSAAYVVVLFAACVVITGLLGWWPDRFVGPALALAAAVTVVAALRCSAPRCCRPPRTGSPSSWRSAPGSPRACSASSARA